VRIANSVPLTFNLSNQGLDYLLLFHILVFNLIKVLLKKTICIFLIILASGTRVYSQSDSINNYYSDLSDLLALKAYFLYKVNMFEIIYKPEEIVLIPNSPLGVGAGFNFKGLGLALGIGLPHSSKNLNKYGTTNRFDMQMSIYSKRIGGDAYFQLYKGYYNANPQDFITWENDYFPQIPDMKTISFGANIFYILNYKRFSNKAAYSRTQVQKKSAGSLLFGYFLNYDESDSPKGFIPQEFPDSIASEFDIRSFRYFATGFSVGYTYTWVISSNFFLNGAIVPGFGYKDIRMTTTEGQGGDEKNPHGQLLLRAAFGYESKYFYAGLTGSTLIRNITYKDYEINLATEQLRFFIGKRIEIKKRSK